ncbi:MAG: damage-inducible protein DinB [Pyrinomonas sp.]|uniref:DinB family protein n=1 Tax=Pyrinomonas sp. TaxID=2080306 RepID=UPI00332FE869
MKISDMLLPEFEQEIEGTRRLLERLPDDKFDWRPHAKSMSLGELATHIANIPSWASVILTSDAFDMIGPDGQPIRLAQRAGSRHEVLQLFERNADEARRAIAATSDEEFAKEWSLLSGGQKIFGMARYAVLRRMVFNHLVHHRAQLGVYSRLNDVAVPAIYGPSADES